MVGAAAELGEAAPAPRDIGAAGVDGRGGGGGGGGRSELCALDFGKTSWGEVVHEGLRRLLPSMKDNASK